ncbi:MAG: hypothetical protein ACE5OS_12665 [Anaerolineae bacterium]
MSIVRPKKPASEPADVSTDVTPTRQAFLLGWTLAEMLGRLRRGARPVRRRPVSEDYAPRLSVSDNEPGGSGRAFWTAARRLLALAEALDLLEEDADQRDAWEQQLRDLPLQIETAEAQGDIRYTTPAELREILDRWSLAAQGRLNARSPDLTQALTAGASLADTCWYLRSPPRPSKTELSRPRSERLAKLLDRRLAAGDWRRLLSYYRLNVERTRVNSLRYALPSYVPDVLIRHLRAWTIGEVLYYDDLSRLRRRPWWQSPAFQMWLPRRMRRQNRSPILLPEDEIALVKALNQQETRWRQMLFGFRRPEDFLHRRDYITICLLRRLLLSLLLLGIGLAAGVLLYALGLIATAAVWPAFQPLMQGVELGDWLKVITTVAGWLSVLGLLGKALFQWTREAQAHIHHWLVVLFIARRAYVPWDRMIRERERGKA